MNERITRLRNKSQDSEPYITFQRAELLTDFYMQSDDTELSVPVRRAMAFKHIMENKKICVMRGELIVGERGKFPKSTPTYPEICLHTVDDLQQLNDREKQYFLVDEETKKVYSEKIIPYWKNRNLRDRIMGELPKEWKDAYEAGVFTEFQEQRAPGHTVLGKKMFEMGFNDLIKEIDDSIARLDFCNDPKAFDKKE